MRQCSAKQSGKVDGAGLWMLNSNEKKKKNEEALQRQFQVSVRISSNHKTTCDLESLDLPEKWNLKNIVS